MTRPVHAAAILTIGLTLGLVSCSVSESILILDGAAAAVAAVAADPNLPAALVPYFSAAATELECDAAAFQTGGTNLQVGAALGTCGLTAVKPLIPAGTPALTVSLINDAWAAIQAVLKQQQAIVTADNSAGRDQSYGNSFFGPNANKPVKLKMADKAKLKTIRAKLEAAKAKLKK
jgi:hypothetical protein